MYELQDVKKLKSFATILYIDVVVLPSLAKCVISLLVSESANIEENCVLEAFITT